MKRLILASTIAGLLAAAPAFAQGTQAPPAPSKAPAATTTQKNDELMNKAIYSSDGKNLGSVAAVTRSSDGKVSDLTADIGGFLGIGSHRIALNSSQFTVGSDRIVLSLTADQAKALPEVPIK